MAKVRVKPIHLITFTWECLATCNEDVQVRPIEVTVTRYGGGKYLPKGTFNATKVTCQRCLKSEDYKTAMDKIKYPLLFWKDNV